MYLAPFAQLKLPPGTEARPFASSRSPVLTVVMQHAEEAAHLHHVRKVLVRAPHVDLQQLGRLDERLDAHLDGLVVAGAAGRALVLAQLDDLSAGAVITAGTLALLTGDELLWCHLLPLAQAEPVAARGLVSALAWVQAPLLQGVVTQLLASPDPTFQALGLRACVAHRVDPGEALTRAVADAGVAGSPTDTDPDATVRRDTNSKTTGLCPGAAHAALRACAWQVAAVLGRIDLAPQCAQALADESPQVRAAAAVALCQLAPMALARASARKALLAAASRPGAQGLAVWARWLAASPLARAQELVRGAATQAKAITDATERAAAHRRLIQSFALLGDTQHLPWLCDCMAEPTLARLAGEAFSWITGADLARDSLETLQVPAFDAGPNEDAADADVALDDDQSLPWPDPARVQHWLHAHTAQWPAHGVRTFMGQRADDQASLQQVLRSGKQHQRHHAALLLQLQRPGTPLFPTAAPARRQLQLLAAS